MGNTLFWVLTNNNTVFNSRDLRSSHLNYYRKNVKMITKGYDFKYGDYMNKQAEDNTILTEQFTEFIQFGLN